MCQISVITSVYNGERFIRETIESIQAQTVKDWEYLIIDNCSTDHTVEIIENIATKDPRIKLIRNKENVGQIPNLNKAIEMAKGKYIARTDADDISYPLRFEKQLMYMEEHPETVIVGCEMDQWWDGTIKHFSGEHVFTDESEIAFGTQFFCTMPHSSFFIRRSALLEHGIRYRNYRYAEDWAMIADLLEVGSGYKLPDVLIMYRIYGGQMTQKLPAEIRISETEEIMLRYLETQPVKDKDVMGKAISGELSTKEDFKRYENSLCDYAKKGSVFGRECVQKAYWQTLNWQVGGRNLFFAYATSSLKKTNWFFTRRGLIFFKKCVIHRGRQ